MKGFISFRRGRNIRSAWSGCPNGSGDRVESEPAPTAEVPSGPFLSPLSEQSLDQLPGCNAKRRATMAATSATPSNQIFSINPYENHPSLTQVEADVLWEYAKLNQHIKDVRTHHTV